MGRFLSFLSARFIVFLTLQPISATIESPNLCFEYTYLYNPISNIEYIDNKSDERIYSASMTKILTVSLCLETIDDLNKKVVLVKQDFAGL